MLRLKTDYLEAVEGIRKHLLRYTHPNHFAFVGSLYSDQIMFKNDMVGRILLSQISFIDINHLYFEFPRM